MIVQAVKQLTPQLTRVVVSGDLQNWAAEIPGGHFKLFVPSGANGDAGEDRVMRTYTARACDPAQGLLTIDFAIHAQGPATAWAKRAQPGQVLQISGSARPGYTPSPGANFTLFIADQSALPAVAAIVEALPAGYRAKALIEVPSEAEILDLATAADLEVEWFIESSTPCERLVAAALVETAGDGLSTEYWVGCEADAMRAIRRHLLHEQGISPRALHTRAYWKQSVANHSDHDTGEDVD